LAVTNFEHPYRHHRWVPDLSIGYEHAFVQAIADCPNGVETGAPAEPTFRTALQTTEGVRPDPPVGQAGQWVETGVGGRTQT
jgi:hypothetical protein